MDFLLAFFAVVGAVLVLGILIGVPLNRWANPPRRRRHY